MSGDKKRPPSPLLQDADFHQLCRDLLRSGEISSSKVMSCHKVKQDGDFDSGPLQAQHS